MVRQTCQQLMSKSAERLTTTASPDPLAVDRRDSPLVTEISSKVQSLDQPISDSPNAISMLPLKYGRTCDSQDRAVSLALLPGWPHKNRHPDLPQSSVANPSA